MIRPAQYPRSNQSLFYLGADPNHICNLSTCNINCHENKTHQRLLVFEINTAYGAKAKVLIDCGSTTDFISKRFVHKNNIPTVNTDQCQVVKLADGSKQLTCKIVEQFPLFISSRSMKANLLVLPIENYDIILGMPWLRKHNPIIDWSTNSLHFPPTPLQLILAEHGVTSKSILSTPSSISKPPIEICHLSIKQIRKAVKQNELLYILWVRQSKATGAIEILNNVEIENDAQGALASKEMQKLLGKYSDVFPEDLPKGLPPKRFIEHRIKLMPHDKPPFKNYQRLSPGDLDELKAEITRLLDQGFIRVAHSPFGCPVVFAKKPGDTKRRLCIDYRDLNRLTIKDKYPLPRVDELMDRLHGAKYFSKLDLRSGYHQVRIADEDIEKTAFNTRYGQYEFLVMPFGLTGAPSTFMALMNQLMAPFLDQFVVVYLDDILIYSKTLHEHMHHVESVLNVLRQNKLYCKQEKCEFLRKEVKFLGYLVGDEGLKVDPAKVEAVQTWPIPTNVRDVRSFLGFVGFYRKFIKDHSNICTPLSELTKTADGAKFEWNAAAQEAFEKMKEALCSTPILILPDPEKPYVVTTDASGYAIGACLSQDQGNGLQPICYMSKKMLDAETRYPVHHKELLAIVCALKEWRHYLHGTKFKIVIRTDHKSLVHFDTQPKLSERQARWNEYMSEFDYIIEYQEGKTNVVADALSRRADHNINVHATLSAIEISLVDEIKHGYQNDDFCKSVMQGVITSRVNHFTINDGLIWYDNKRLVVPLDPALRTKLLHENHDSKLAGHLGIEKTYAKMVQLYYWPTIYSDTKKYVRTCLICQRTKHEHGKQRGLLQPLPIPTRRWQIVTMDFIIHLPKTKNGYDAIFVVVDKLTKRAYYIATTTNVTAPEVAQLYFKHIVKNGHGIPESIVSDRDSRFTSLFWKSLWEMLDTKLRMSTASHPQTDGQTENMNKTLEQILRAFCNNKQDNWDELLPYAEIAYNSAKNLSTGYSPFYLDHGQEASLPANLLHGKYLPDSGNAKVEEVLEELGEALKLVQSNLQKAQQRQKKYADMKRKDIEYAVGDRVLLDTSDIHFTVGTKKLLDRFIGPYKIIERIGAVAYKLDLPAKFRLHPVFHISKLRKALETDDFPGRDQLDRPEPVMKIDGEDAWYVDKIINKRKQGNKTQYLVVWEGYPEWEATWEDSSRLLQAKEAVAQFESNQQH